MFTSLLPIRTVADGGVAGIQIGNITFLLPVFKNKALIAKAECLLMFRHEAWFLVMYGEICTERCGQRCPC